MKTAFREVSQLIDYLDLPQKFIPEAFSASRQFPLFVTHSYADKMEPKNPKDPLLLQVLPSVSETNSKQGFTRDPVGDSQASIGPGFIKKYQGRALLITTGACAVHCRYCFRRHFPYQEQSLNKAAWEKVTEQLKADPSIEELILSGGDPLTIVDESLAELIEQLESIPTLKRLRIHSRLPLFIPQRVTPALVHLLSNSRLTPVFVIHCNHAQELDQFTLNAISRLIEAGIPVLNQTVLLKEINDNVVALQTLCERLIDHRIMPYYLHQLDKVQGATHFEVPVKQGIDLVQQLRSRLPGYAVPRYVQEVAGESCKRVLC